MPLTESSLLKWIHQNLPSGQDIRLKNGDDAAVIATPHGLVIVTTDMLLDGTHFDVAIDPPELIGRKTVAVNLSDLAAMGALPQSLFMSLGIPRSFDKTWVQRFFRGAADLARDFQCGIDGGDTNIWRGPFVVNITAIGSPHWRGPVSRKNAKVGDAVMISGQSLGGSFPSRRHLEFTPRVDEARWLLDHFEIHSMMDISDGLSADLPKLAVASGCHILIDAAAVHDDDDEDEAGLRSAMTDGEDFELLFTCTPTTAQQITDASLWPCGFRIIGRVTSNEYSRVSIARGTAPPIPLPIGGYEHRAD